MKSTSLKIVFILDESGSMRDSKSDVIGGFNSFIDRHKMEKDIDVNVSLYKFNNEITNTIDNKPVSNVPNLTNNDYKPNGFTALYDAIGISINSTDIYINSLSAENRPDSVMVVIFTDGEENASKLYTSTAIKSIIETHEKLLKWNFIYLGTDIKDFSDADALGIQNRIDYKRNRMASKFDTIADSTIMFCINGVEDVEEKKLTFIERLMSKLKDNN